MIRRHHRRDKSEALYHAGSDFKGIIAIRAGTVKLMALNADGDEYVVDLVLPGELIGFDGVSEGIYRCTAVALEVVRFCRLDACQLVRLGSRAPYLHQVVLQRACETFDRQVNRLWNARRTSEVRVAVFLLDVSERLRIRGYSEAFFKLSLSRADIGNYLGLAHETVSRVLHLFQARGWIEIKAKQVCITNKQALIRFSGA
ncbi:MAG: helix-turn-helix domain-containing protein [Methylococcales bacterium]|nr:helix-turn-helix domain-containing protein [Methylococcales bacterium]